MVKEPGYLSRFNDGLTDWTAEIQLPARKCDFLLLHGVQAACGVHPASYPTGIGGSFPVKQSGRETDHSCTSSADAKNSSFVFMV
jgi:hypothetical protein